MPQASEEMTMKHGKGVVPPLLLVLALSACSSGDSQLEIIANQFSEAVNRCVIDVRDKTSKIRNFPKLPFPC